MQAADRQAWLALPVILAVGGAIAWAGSQGGGVIETRWGGCPLFALCGGLSFAINWIVFVPAYRAQTERYYDLTGSLTYLSVTPLALVSVGVLDPRRLLLAAMVVVWAARLGTFLFRRITRDGSDGRFDAIKPSFPRFLMAWTLQGLWVLLTLGCALAALTSRRTLGLDAFALAGGVVWGLGFAIEATADAQKRRFRANPANRGRFIDVGLWRWSRHPNYFGEITLWVGVALVALPVLEGWQYATLISPVFVYLLLTRISGVPLLEARARKRWAEDPAYRAYCERTPVLFPRPPSPA